jgi:hypothetical protein
MNPAQQHDILIFREDVSTLLGEWSFMLNIEASDEPGSRGEGHDRWLAMKSAYAEYRRASEALECTTQVTDAPDTGESLRLSTLDGEQRVAFERYLEARMEFLESQCDDRNWRMDPPELPARNEGFFGINSRFGKFDWILRALTIVVLITAASFLVRAQRHVHRLELAYEELRASLNETRGGMQLYQKEADDRPDLPSPTEQIERAAPPAFAPRGSELKRAGEQRPRPRPAQPVQPRVAAQRGRISKPRSPNSGAGSYHSFSLSPFHRFKHIGPVEVSLRSFDSQRGCVGLSIVSNSSKVEPDCLRVNRPLQIKAGSRAQRLQLVVDRIADGNVHGHLIEFRDEKSDLSANRIRSGTRANP